MKKDIKNNGFENSLLYKHNIKIHNNLLKVYILTLLISSIILFIKGFN